ncbi:MAG: hypothetical protein M1405_01495 [Patescibacteria group bacterium]|nr:hypothetical protein [Patescibacteria group bacterium]
MAEKQPVQIEIIGEVPSKRDYCRVSSDGQIRSALSCLLILERQLSYDSLAEREKEGAVLAHTIIWNSLPYEYKSELADLTAITA